MPRGVYDRKSGPAKRAKPAAKVQTKAAGAPVSAPVAPVAQAAPVTYGKHDFRKSVDDMDGDLLKAYAKSLGIMQRDIDHLTQDRLRQNCKVRVFEAIEG